MAQEQTRPCCVSTVGSPHHAGCHNAWTQPTLPGMEHTPTPLTNSGMRELVNHPQHYGGDTTYEVIKVLDAWGLDADAYLFNVVKYIARAGKKDDGTLQELRKARWYLDRRIARLEREVASDGT